MPRRSALLLLVTLLAPGAALARAPRPAPRPAAWWKERHEQLGKLPDRARAQLVFVGDSITSGWLGAGAAVWKRHFERYRPLDLGISGDRTRHLHWRLQHGALDGLSPRLVVLLIGINDLCFYGTPVRDVVDGILANVAELRARLPRTRVLLLGLLPSGARPATSLRDRISRTNRLLSRAADDEEVRFLDVGPSLLEPDGTLGPAAAPDHLHLTERGYRLWAEAMAPVIRQLVLEKR